MIKKVLLTLTVIVIINFFLPRLMPGDPFTLLSVEDGITNVTLTDQQVQYYLKYYGMDQPLWQQFLDYITNLVQGDFGESIYYKQAVTGMVFERLFWTLALVLASLVISTLLGVILGIVSAYFKETIPRLDRLLLQCMTVLSEVPNFIVGLILLLIFAAYLGWLPLSGGLSPFANYRSVFEGAKDYLLHATLPIATLVITSIGDMYLLSRQSVLKVIKEPYITTALAKGLSKKKIFVQHIFLNASSPIISRVFMQMGTMLSGAVLVENVFAYPGIGRLMREAIVVRDYILIQGIFFFMAVFVVLFNQCADIIYNRLDQRIKL